MTEPKIITASLEGARVLTDGQKCELQEYNFKSDKWQSKEKSAWPLSRPIAERWLHGWNAIDKLAATSVLTGIGNVDRLPLEIKGLDLLSAEGLEELRQYVDKEMMRRRAKPTSAAKPAP